MWSLASGARSRCAAASPDAGDSIYAAYDFDDPGDGAWQDLTCTHDDNGNLTSDGLHSYTYDAWNRLVAVAYDNAVAGDTDPTIATYVYDGLFRRISKTVSGARGDGIVYNSDADGSGIVAGFRSEHYFYAGWRVVEVTNWDLSAFGDYDHTTADVLGQFVYGTQYVDEPVRYDRNLDVGTNDSCIGGGGEGASSDAIRHGIIPTPSAA